MLYVVLLSLGPPIHTDERPLKQSKHGYHTREQREGNKNNGSISDTVSQFQFAP